jgi:Concanavalin A-like lectin/glucanases superfamily
LSPCGQALGLTATKDISMHRTLAVVFCALIGGSARGDDLESVLPLGEATLKSAAMARSLQFNGASDEVAIPDSTALRLKCFTISAWIRTENAESIQPLVAKAEAAGNWVSYMLRIQKDGKLSLVVENFAAGADIHWCTQQPLTSGKWHHVAATWHNARGDNTDAKIYIDGVDQEIEVIRNVNYGPGFEPGYSDLPLFLGRDQFPSGYFRGQMENVEIHGRVLSREEIRALFDRGRSRREEDNSRE